MHKKRKILLIAVGIPIVIAAILFISVLLMMRIEISKLTPLATCRLLSNVYAIKNEYVNFYVIGNSDSLIVIDAGINDKLVAQDLKNCGIDPLKVTSVLLTHTDNDHVAAVSLFPNASIYIARQEEQMINGKTKRAFFIRNSLKGHYTLLDDYQTIHTAGNVIKCILTPGHTPGSMCYLVNDSCLFTGDNISLNKGKVQPFTKLFNQNTGLQIKSWSKIADLPEVRYIFTAHHGYSNEYKQSFSQIRKE